MNFAKTSLLVGTICIIAISGSAFAGSDKLARIMGFGGVCSDCDLSKKNLSDARLNGASFPRSNFTGADLSGAELDGSNFSRAIFSRADLSDVNTTGSNFSWADFSGATLNDLNAHSINMSHAILNGAKAADAEFAETNFSHSKMLGIYFPDAKFENCNLSHADFAGARFHEAEFTRSNLSHTRLDDADLREAEFDHVDFRNALFGSAKLKDVSFTEVYLVGADLSNVRGLKSSQLEESCGDSTTKLPRGVSLTDCEDVYWAEDFTATSNGGRSFSFSYELSDEDVAELEREVESAMAEGRLALAEAGRALAEALDSAEFDRGEFEWNFSEKQKFKNKWKINRSQRTLSRSIRSLSDIEVSSANAQDEIDLAIASLERAQEILEKSAQEQELAGQ
jgi:uncharacterized protein YjbI with pentapeptide repeats